MGIKRQGSQTLSSEDADGRLPYEIGNAGDLLKHGVLAEYIRWRCEQGGRVRFVDLFGGEVREGVEDRFKDRVLALPEASALRCAQAEIDRGWYLGSGLLARNAGAQHVLTNDRDAGHRRRLKEAGLVLLADEFQSCISKAHDWDACRLLDVVVHELCADDLVFVDPFAAFLPKYANDVLPRLAQAIAERQATILLFALNSNPRNRVGRRFDDLLAEHLPGAWRITCPPHRGLEFHADVVLAMPPALAQPAAASFRPRLEWFTEHLRAVLFPLAVQEVEAPRSTTGSQPGSRRVEALHRLFELFDGNDASAEVRRLKLEDEGF